MLPDIGGNKPEDRNDWLVENKDKFKPHSNSSKSECQPRTAKIIKNEALQANKCGKDAPAPLAEPADLDKWSEERLVNGMKYMQDVNNTKYEGSNESYITRLNLETGVGCFYEKKLLEGLKVKVHGQALVRVAGRLMTKREAGACVFDQVNTNLAPPDDNILFINLGLHAQSYPLILTPSGSGQDGTFREEELVIEPSYTEKFALRDLMYMYMGKQPNVSFLAIGL